MVELVDTLGLGPRGNSLAGSSPAIRKSCTRSTSLKSTQPPFVLSFCKQNDKKIMMSHIVYNVMTNPLTNPHIVNNVTRLVITL